MRRCPAFLLWLPVFALASCGGSGEAPEEPLPNTPEEVVRQYQAWYDANDYARAKRLSTENEARRLDQLEGMLQGLAPDSTLLRTEFVDVQCRALDNTAFCYCLLEDQYERYQTLFFLRRENGQWLVESPEAEWPPDDVEEAFEELMQDILPGDSAVDIRQ